MQVTVEFTCPKCGLLSPGLAKLPDDVHPRTPVHLTHECFHCDEPLEMKARAGELIAAARNQ